LKQQLTYTDASLPTIKQSKHSLYHNYGAMLLGYIQEAVKEQAIAEQYLVELFSELKASDIMDIMSNGANQFLRLQHIARKKLSSFFSNMESCTDQDELTLKKAINGNKFIDMMRHEQKLVFCGVHYHGKTIAKLAAELNKPEDAIRQLLRESFTIIRNNRNDTAVHQ
jgi:acetylornithine/succinyldiaminopimelate/putrescine aminotransferase